MDDHTRLEGNTKSAACPTGNRIDQKSRKCIPNIEGPKQNLQESCFNPIVAFHGPINFKDFVESWANGFTDFAEGWANAFMSPWILYDRGFIGRWNFRLSLSAFQSNRTVRCRTKHIVEPTESTQPYISRKTHWKKIYIFFAIY